MNNTNEEYYNDLATGFNAASSLHPFMREAQTISTVTSVLPNLSTWKERMDEICNLTSLYINDCNQLFPLPPVKTFNPTASGSRTITIFQKYSTTIGDNFDCKGRDPNEVHNLAFPPHPTCNYIANANIKFYVEKNNQCFRKAVKIKLHIVMLQSVVPNTMRQLQLFENAVYYLNTMSEANPQMLNVFPTEFAEASAAAADFFSEAADILPKIGKNSDNLKTFLSSISTFVEQNDSLDEILAKSVRSLARDSMVSIGDHALPILSLVGFMASSVNLIYSVDQNKYYYFIIATLSFYVFNRKVFKELFKKIVMMVIPYLGIVAQGASGSLMSGMAMILLGLVNDTPSLPTSWVPALLNVERLKGGLTAIFTLLLDLILAITRGIGLESKIPKNIKYFFYNNDEVVDYVTAIDDVQEQIRTKRFKLNQDNYLILQTLIKRGNTILLHLPTQSKSGGAYGIVRDQLSVLKSLREIFAASNFDYDGRRVEPVSVLFAGPPKNGKTEVTDHVIAAIMSRISTEEEIANFSKNSSNYIYVVPPENDFWDGYKNQMFTLFNDFQQTTDVAGTPGEAIKLIRSKDTTPYILNMAHLNDKGNTLFSSPVIVATTNASRFVCPSVMDIEALNRRFDFAYTAVIKAEYSNSSRISDDPWHRSIDYTKLPIGRDGVTSLHPEYMDFYPYNLRTGSIVGSSITFDEVINLIVERKETHIQRFNQKSKELLDTMHKHKPKKIFLLPDDFKKSILVSDAIFNVPKDSPDVHMAELETLLEHTEPQGLLDILNKTVGDYVRPDYKFHVFIPTPMEEGGTIVKMLDYMRRNQDEPDTKTLISFCKNLNTKVIEIVGYSLVDITSALNIIHMQQGDGVFEKIIKEEIFVEDIFISSEFIEHFQPYVFDISNNAVQKLSLNYEDYFSWFMDKDKMFWISNFFVVLGLWKSVSPLIKLANTVTHYFNTKEDNNTSNSKVNVEAQSFPNLKQKTKMVNKPVVAQSFPNLKSKKSFVNKPVSSVQPQMGAGYDPNGNNVIEKIIRRNYYVLKYKKSAETDWKILGHILVIADNIAIMPMHFYNFFKQAIAMDTDRMTRDSSVLLLKYCDGTFKESVYLVASNFVDNVAQCGKMDQCDQVLVQICNSKFLTHANILEYISDKNEISKLPSCIPYTLLVTNNTLVKEHSGVARLTSLAEVVHPDFEPYSIDMCYSYNVSTQSGDCGALFTVTNANFKSKIFGMHVAGKPQVGMGFSSAFVREDIQDCLKFFDFIQSAVPQYNGNISFPLPTSMEFIGNAPKGVFAAGATKICESSLHNCWPCKQMAPCNLTTSAFLLALNKYNKPPIQIQPKIIDRISHSLFDSLRSSSPNKLTPRLYSFEEAVYGIPGTEYSSISRSTSAGYPFVHMSKGGKSIKEIYFGKGEPFQITKEGYKFQEQINHKIDKLIHKERVEFYFVDNLKDEKKPIEKVNLNKTRMFSGVSLDHYLIVRMYFGAFIHYLTVNRIHNSIAVGVNPYSTEWHHIATKFGSKVGTEDAGFTAGDFSGFDTAGKREIYMSICDQINIWYGGTEEDSTVRKMLFLELCQSRHIRGSMLYEWEMSLPSGHPLTVYINSLYNLFAIRYCWWRANDNCFSALAEFDKYVYFIVYGDDSNGAVSAVVREVFNEYTIQVYMAELGLTYTSDTKDSFATNHRKIQNITFLKRSFIFNKLEMIFVAPLNLEVVLYVPQWTKKGFMAHQITCDSVDTALRELALHGKCVFDKWAPVIINASYEHLNYYPKCTDFYTLYDLVRNLEFFL